MRKNYQWSILKGFTQKSIMNFSKIMKKKKTIKPSGTGKEDKPLLLSNEYNPFEIAPREINIGKPLIDVRIKDDSTVICVYVEITKEVYTSEYIEEIRTNYHNNKRDQ